MRLAVLSLVFALPAAACLDAGKGEEEDLLDDAKEDSHRNPTDHGPIAFGERATAEITDDERYHAWTFELAGDAHVTLTTSYALLGQRRTDTVLYLYKAGDTGWGPYIARNDDYADTTYSQLVRDLGPGQYRALVKGFLGSTRGKFSLTVDCAGDGCAPVVDPNACLFGAVYRDIFESPALSIINTTTITIANLDTLGPVDQQRLVRAVQQSSHTDVTTPEEALGRVDQGEVNVTWIAEPLAQRTFAAFEYGAGDNSYGAVFDRTYDTMVTNIHDGDLENCTVQAETCLLSDDWLAMRSDPAFERTGGRVVTQASELSGVEIEQVMIAFRQSYEDVADVADGLSRVDGNQLNVVHFTHTASGAEVDVVEYGAGDTSVGTIFYAGTTERAGIINDLSIEGCTLFE